MFDLARFLKIYGKLFPLPDVDQLEVISEEKTSTQFVVAGPGSGKTSCLTLRVLKLILVDSVPPNKILVTTFTIKAAEELRSRILSRGYAILAELFESKLSLTEKEFIDRIDINQILLGTLDSVCEQLISRFRTAGQDPISVVDDFIANTLLLTESIFPNGGHRDDNIQSYLTKLSTPRYGAAFSTPEIRRLISMIWDRRSQDRIRWEEYRNTHDGAIAIDKILETFEKALRERHMVDFCQLESMAMSIIHSLEKEKFKGDFECILVDEYQDTNALQEAIYFGLVEKTGSSLTVVGDDDQSLYRFRGATIEL